MKKYNYRVIDINNRPLSGIVEANNRAQAAGVLRGKKMTIVGLSELRGSIFDELAAAAGKPKFEEVTNFTRQLSTMIASGLPLIEALRILKEQSRAQMGRVVDQILNEIEGGSSLGGAMEKTQGVFSNVYIALVKAGESAGDYEENGGYSR